MMRTIVVTLILTLILTLVSCGGSGEQASTDADALAPTPGSGAATTLSEDYADALSVRSQLMLGILGLEETDLAVTPEQATELLPLWQVSLSLTRSGTGASEEVTAVLNQIEAAMTPAQVDAIAAMQLTRADNQAVAQELGLTTGTGEGSGGGERGQGQNLSPDEQATRQAERAATTSTGASEALLGKLIELLEARK